MMDTDEELLAWRPTMPPRTQTEDGKPRRIGVEIEMIGLDVDDVSSIVAKEIGGRLEVKSRYEHLLRGDEAGDWGIELDYAYLKERGREDEPEDDLIGKLDEATESLLRVGAEAVVPVEIVSPPLPFERLADIQKLIVAMRTAGAKGSGAGLAYAFGMQFNPELPALESRMIASYLKAFFCLFDWLVRQSDVDMTRRLSGYSASFPGNYVRKVVDPKYWPQQDELIDDYLEDNPTRNRALDMLPLFLHLDKERLRAVVDDPRVKPRPTLHYRLPNSEIDQQTWGVHVAWNDWLQVEKLACNPELLQEICVAYVAWLDKPLARLFENWADEVLGWLEPSNA